MAAGAGEPREADFLAHYQALAREYPRELARAALETAVLRREAASKFPAASRMYFTREALEQATAYPVAAYRAERFRGCSLLVDLGCSIGGDTLAMAAIAPTVGLDRDRLRLLMARANLRALGLGERADFVQADLTDALPVALTPSTGLFFDPARRSGGQRLLSVRDYLPPLETILGWIERSPAAAVKLSPGVSLEELAGYRAEVEFISLTGDLKEAVLWFGPLRTAERRATLLPGPHTLSRSGPIEPLPLDSPRLYLYEPDPAVLRAGLVEDLGHRLEAAQLDPDIAYLTADRRVETPFARAWQVEAWMPFQLKRLRSALRERSVGRVTVKKRGSPLQPEELIRKLRPAGPQARTLFLTHLRGKPIVVLCYPEENRPGAQSGALKPS